MKNASPVSLATAPRHHRRRAVVHIELSQDVLHVLLHGPQADAKQSRHLPVAFPSETQ